ncbi:hypothetical protein, partial [Pusillimonas noertemannii]
KAVALERQRAFLSCLEPEESRQLIDLLHRLHANLPNVERATQRYLREHVVKPGHERPGHERPGHERPGHEK